MVRTAPAARTQSPKNAASPHSTTCNGPTAVGRLGDAPRPIWLPLGEGADCAAPEVRQAAVALIQPFFDEHVANSDNSIERMLAASLVYLMWNEVLEHHERKREQVQPEPGPRPAEQRGAVIDRQLKVIDRKLRIAQFLLKLRQMRAANEKSGRPSPLEQCGLTREKLREAMFRAASSMPGPQPGPAAKPQAEMRPQPQPQMQPGPGPGPGPGAVNLAAKPQAAPRPAVKCAALDDRQHPTFGSTNIENDPHEFRSITQIAPATHTSGEKGSAAKGQNRTARCLNK